jgi:hypothetical protein
MNFYLFRSCLNKVSINAQILVWETNRKCYRNSFSNMDEKYSYRRIVLLNFEEFLFIDFI